MRLARDGQASVTVPYGVDQEEVRAFLERNRAWLAGARARLPKPVPVREGALIPVDGVLRRLERSPKPGLGPDRLSIGPRADVPKAAVRFLKAHAEARLVPEARRVAQALGRPIAAIAFRDTRSRWGSCSGAGRLSFSWRIAMAPPEVQQYLAVHEAAHLAEMNHSARFWALVGRHMPGYAASRDWLRREGGELHRYRFE